MQTIELKDGETIEVRHGTAVVTLKVGPSGNLLIHATGKLSLPTGFPIALQGYPRSSDGPLTEEQCAELRLSETGGGDEFTSYKVDGLVGDHRIYLYDDDLIWEYHNMVNQKGDNPRDATDSGRADALKLFLTKLRKEVGVPGVKS